MKDYTEFQIDRLETLYRNFKNAAFEDINHEFPRLFEELRNISVFDSILSELKNCYPVLREELLEWNDKICDVRQNQIYGEYAEDRYASLLLHWCDYLLKNKLSYTHTNLNELACVGLENESAKRKEQNYFKECIIGKIVLYIKRKLKDVRYSLYLLNRYKTRSEVFKKEELQTIYKNNPDKSERVLQDNLRLFLFEQGVEYPFSCAELSVGKTDVYAHVSPNDCMLTEVKILDINREYRLNRLSDGFSQLVKYVNELQVSVGYLVVFNFDDSLPVIVTEKGDNNVIILNNKIYHIVFVNLYNEKSASKHRCEIIPYVEENVVKDFKIKQ